MIIGIVAFFTILFGGGSPEIFYVDNIDKGVKKYVVDKDIKKELTDTLKWTTKAVEDFRKEQKRQIKELKTMNLNKNATKALYLAFFDLKNKERLELHAEVIDMRAYVQTRIKPDEWKQIMDMAEASAEKTNDKSEKKDAKKPADTFKDLKNTVTKHVTDADRQAIILDAVDMYELAFNKAKKIMEDNDVENRSLLSDQNATKADMFAFHKALAKVRNDYYAAYMVFYFVVQETTNEGEFTPIIKAFNKSF